MAENKEITTLHPYMNRNKNRYPNVREENIPDTIQRKLTAGTGISISPENVISATGGDSYTRSETDALLDTKADKVALENVNKVVPTDIAVKNGKLGLEHDTTWLTNQNAITLGDGLSYDEATKTLKASGGGKLPNGSYSDPFIFKVDETSSIKFGAVTNYTMQFSQQNYSMIIGFDSELRITSNNIYSGSTKIVLRAETNNNNIEFRINSTNGKFVTYNVDTSNSTNKGGDKYIPAIEHPSSDGMYNLQITKNGNKYHYDWIAGGSGLPTYNHYIVINDTTTANAIYLLIPSTNNLKCNSLTDLDTLLGTAQRFIQASGVVTGNASKLPIVAINWQGSFSSSKIVTMSSEEATTNFTNVVDVVEPA